MKLQHCLSIITLLYLTIFAYCKLVIQSPPDLKAKLEQLYPDGIRYSVANYGDVPFGKSLAGTLYTGSVLQNCIYEDLSTEAQRNINKIVLSTRGDCTFTTKSLNSQKQGAKMAIIADNQQYEDPGSIIMVDDGKGPQVKIPTILIDHEVGAIITDFMFNKSSTVSLIINFQTSKRKIADVTLWMNAYDRKSYMLIRDLEPYLSRINQSITLNVYHPTTYCKSCLETDCFGGKDFCINTGFYGYMLKGFGQELIKQQLKEEIILKRYPEKWWKYVQTYDQECERENMVDCSYESMRNLGIDPEKINQQVQSSFYNKTEKDEVTGQQKIILANKILQRNDQLRYRSGLLIFPGVIVNNVTYRGNLDPLEVFELICQSFETEPAGCNLQVVPTEHSIWKFILVIGFMFIAVMIFLILIYRRQARREISKNLNSEVNDLVNQYITMYEAQRFDTYEMNNMTGSSTMTKQAKQTKQNN